VTYRTLKYIFGLDDALLGEIGEIQEELILRRLAINEQGKVLAWTGEDHPVAYPAVAIPSPPALTDATTVRSGHGHHAASSRHPRASLIRWTDSSP
jgi:hypothetical protein